MKKYLLTFLMISSLLIGCQKEVTPQKTEEKVPTPEQKEEKAMPTLSYTPLENSDSIMELLGFYEDYRLRMLDADEQYLYIQRDYVLGQMSACDHIFTYDLKSGETNVLLTIEEDYSVYDFKRINNHTIYAIQNAENTKLMYDQKVIDTSPLNWWSWDDPIPYHLLDNGYVVYYKEDGMHLGKIEEGKLIEKEILKSAKENTNSYDIFGDDQLIGTLERKNNQIIYQDQKTKEINTITLNHSPDRFLYFEHYLALGDLGIYDLEKKEFMDLTLTKIENDITYYNDSSYVYHEDPSFKYIYVDLIHQTKTSLNENYVDSFGKVMYIDENHLLSCSNNLSIYNSDPLFYIIEIN